MKAFLRRSVWVWLLAGCVGRLPPPPPPPARISAGDLLRFRYLPDEVRSYKVRLYIEQETDRSPKKLALRLDFSVEERVITQSAEATNLEARFTDAICSITSGGNQALADQYALAVDELKILLQRSSRGEVISPQVSAVRSPLDESTAKALVNAVFAAQRGPLFPDSPVELAGSWKIENQLIPASGYTGSITYQFTYARRSDGVAYVQCTGATSGRRASGERLIGKSTSEYRLLVETGQLVGMSDDSEIQVGKPGNAPELRQRIRVQISTPPKRS